MTMNQCRFIAARRLCAASTASVVAAVGLLGTVAAQPAHAQFFTENFDDFNALEPAGWFFQNNSAPRGINWYQPTDPAQRPFSSQAGAPESYIAADVNSVATGASGTISNWFLTPALSFRNGDTLSFFSRTTEIFPGQPIFPDRLEVRLSVSGASTNVGTSPLDVGDFSTLLLSINPDLTPTGYPAAWTQFSATISGLPVPTQGRIGFRYFVTDGGDAGSNSEFIGVDTLSIAAIPEPGTVALMAGATLPLLAAGAHRRRRR